MLSMSVKEAQSRLHMRQRSLSLCRTCEVTIWHQLFAWVASLLDLAAEEEVTLAIKLLLNLVRQQMIVLTNELREFLIHLSFSLVLNVCVCVWNNSDQEIEHDNNEEQRSQHKHKVDKFVAFCSKFVMIKVAQHQLVHLSNCSNVAIDKDFISVIVSWEDEECATKCKYWTEEHHEESSHV